MTFDDPVDFSMTLKTVSILFGGGFIDVEMDVMQKVGNISR